jgi:hypothetical protein
MIVKIDVADAFRIGFREIDDNIFVCGSVTGDYIDGKIHIDMNQNMHYFLRVTIMKKVIASAWKSFSYNFKQNDKNLWY